MMDMISELACSVPGAPKDIGAGWTHDRRAGVLGDHQSIKRDAPLLAGKWQVGMDEKWRAIHVQRVVDGNRASRGERYALGADRFSVTRCALDVLKLSIIRHSDNTEEYEGPVLAYHFLGALRSSRYPLTDALQRHLFARDNVTLNENAADRHERIAVMAIVVDAYNCSVFQTHAS